MAMSYRDISPILREIYNITSIPCTCSYCIEYGSRLLSHAITILYISHLPSALVLSNGHFVLLPPTASARNLGYIFDSRISLAHQVSSVFGAFVIFIAYALFLTLTQLAPLTHLLFIPDLTCCNSMYFCRPQMQLNRLHPIQNALALSAR